MSDIRNNYEESRTDKILTSLDDIKRAHPSPYFISKALNRMQPDDDTYIYSSLWFKLSLASVAVIILINIYTIVANIKVVSEEDPKVTFTEEYEFDKSQDDFNY